MYRVLKSDPDINETYTSVRCPNSISSTLSDKIIFHCEMLHDADYLRSECETNTEGCEYQHYFAECDFLLNV